MCKLSAFVLRILSEMPSDSEIWYDNGRTRDKQVSQKSERLTQLCQSCNYLTVKPYPRFIVDTFLLMFPCNTLSNHVLRQVCSTNNGSLLNSNRKCALHFQWDIWLHQFTYVSLFEWIVSIQFTHDVTTEATNAPDFVQLYDACTLRLFGKTLCKTFCCYLRSSLVFCLFLLASTIANCRHRTMAPITILFLMSKRLPTLQFLCVGNIHSLKCSLEPNRQIQSPITPKYRTNIDAATEKLRKAFWKSFTIFLAAMLARDSIIEFCFSFAFHYVLCRCFVCFVFQVNGFFFFL